MAFLTLNECKTILRITDTSKDEQIEVLLPIVKDDISTYCNTDTFFNGMKPAAAMMVNYLLTAKYITGKQSETVGTYTYQNADGKNGYPDVIYSSLNKYKMVSMKSGTIKLKKNDKRGANYDLKSGVSDAACCSDDDAY